MSAATSSWPRVPALLSLITLLQAPPALAETVTFSFSGTITQVSEVPPVPYQQVGVGDAWSLSYTFEREGAVDVDGSDTAGQYRDTVTNVALSIGGNTVSGVPGAAVPGPYTSVTAVNMGTGYADYSVQIGLPGASAWAQVALYDDDGTPFTSDALPQVLPAPYEVFFPDLRRFFLRMPFETSTWLVGELGRASVEIGRHSQVRVDLALGVDDRGNPTISLLADALLFGEQGVASGLLSCPGCEVMGVEPSPFRWAVDPQTGAPAQGEAVVTFTTSCGLGGSPGCEVMGVEPSPFRILVDLGEAGPAVLDLSRASGFYPGPLGGLHLEGVRAFLCDSTVVALEGFDIYDATDKLSFIGTRTDSDTIDAPDALGLLVNNAEFGAGGVAAGFLMCPGCEVMGVEPSPFRWVAVDPQLGPAPDGVRAVHIDLDETGAVSGLGESPFIVSLTADGEPLGTLDLSAVGGRFPGTLGSLALEGVDLILPDGSSLPVEYLDAYDRDHHLTLVDTRVDLRVIETAELTQVDLVLSSTLFGVYGFGSGGITDPGSEVMGVEPSPFRWVVDPPAEIPQDGTAVISYLSDPGAEVMGVEPSPFRTLIVNDANEILGSVDFSMSVGRWGSFHLEGVGVELADGSAIAVQTFDTIYRQGVDIDIKPGSDDNSINLGSAGVIPVAVLSSPSFDATAVDPATISLAGAAVRLVGNGKRYLAHIEDVNGDGLDDLMCQVLTEELSIEVGDSVAVLEARTYDGTLLVGEDLLRIVP